MQTAIYARVSDDKLTAEGERRQDIDRQIENLTKYAKGFPEWGALVIFKDDALSAYKDDYQSRPEFVRLLHEIRGHHVQRVLIEDLTRWSRRINDGLRTMKEASDSGCTVTSIHDGEIDVTTSAGWFRCAIGFLMAEWASKSMSEKVKSGMNRRLQNKEKICETCGIVHIGRHPLSCNCKPCLKTKAKKRVG